MSEGMTTEAGGRKRGRPPATSPTVDRDELLEAAVRAIRAHGPSVSMDAIAEEAGVTKPTVYRVVGDKEAITGAVAEYLSLLMEAQTYESLASTTDPEDQLRRSLRTFFRFLAENRSLFLFIEQGPGLSEDDQLIRMIHRSAKPNIDVYNASSPKDPSEAAARTWAYARVGAINLVGTMWAHDPYCDLEELVELTVRFLYHAPRRSDEKQD